MADGNSVGCSGQIYEKEANYDEAIENYVQAADFFMSDNNTSAAKDCKVRYMRHRE